MRTKYELKKLAEYEYVSFTHANSWGGAIFPYENYRVMVYDHEEEPINFHVICRAYGYDISFSLDGTILKIFDYGSDNPNRPSFKSIESKVKEWLELDSYQTNRIQKLKGLFTNRDWIAYLWEMNNENDL